MPELETLKWEIENKKLSSNYWVFKKTSGSDFIVEQYVNCIADVLEKEPEYISNLSIFRTDLFGNCLAEEDKLYVYVVSQYDIDVIPPEKYSLIVITESSDTDCYTFLKLTEEQLTDYVLSVCSGIPQKSLLNLVNICKNPYRVENEIEKFLLFEEVYRNTLFKLSEEDAFLSDLSDSNIFDFTDAILKNDRVKLISIYKKLKASDVEPLGVVTILYRTFRNAILVKSMQNPTVQSTGLKSEKQIYAISKSLTQFTNRNLLDIFKMLCSVDKKLKTGYLPGNLILDYVVTYILCRC